MASGSRSRRSHISATSALWSAASVPAAPIAMPTRAAASAGASLTPSPTIATGRVGARVRVDGVELVRGQQPGADLVEPRAAATARATGSVSPVSMTTRCDAGRVQRGRERRRPRAGAGRPGRRARAPGRPRRARSRSARLVQVVRAAAGSSPRRSATSRGPPAHSARPSTVAVAPRPGSASKALGARHRQAAFAGGAAQRGGERMLGAALRPRRRARARRPRRAVGARSRCSCGSPRVSVPVLSIATVRTRARSSSAWPPLIRMPRRAAPPTAETTATGTEITSEHGQATISSASAR